MERRGSLRGAGDGPWSGGLGAVVRGGRRVVDLVAGARRDVLYVDEPPGVAIHGDEVVHVVDVDVVLYVVKDPRQDRCEPRLSLGQREHVQRHRRRPEVHRAARRRSSHRPCDGRAGRDREAAALHVAPEFLTPGRQRPGSPADGSSLAALPSTAGSPCLAPWLAERPLLEDLSHFKAHA
jgi:hypothetical protein